MTVDPNTRRAVVNINVPNVNVIETKDEPCTIALQFLNRDGKLHCTAIMRSNDIWFGTPYDWAFFIELQKVIADKLGLGYGTYTHFATSFQPLRFRSHRPKPPRLQGQALQICRLWAA